MSKNNLNTNDSFSASSLALKNILDENETQRLISEVTFLIQSHPIKSDLQKILAKIPEISTRMNLMSEYLETTEKELVASEADVDRLNRVIEQVQIRQNMLNRELMALSAGKTDSLDLGDMPAEITPKSLDHPSFLPFLLAKEKQLKQVQADRMLVQRSLKNCLECEEISQSRQSETREILISLTAVSQEIVQILKETKKVMESDSSVQSKRRLQALNETISAAQTGGLIKRIDKILLRADSMKACLIKGVKTTASEAKTNSEKIGEKPHVAKLEAMRKQDCSERESLLANGDYAQWEASFEDLGSRCRVTEPRELSSATAAETKTPPSRKMTEDTKNKEVLTYIKPRSFLTEIPPDDQADEFDLSGEYLEYRPSEKAHQKVANETFDPILTVEE